MERSTAQRIDDLEHDNNLMRERYAELSQEFLRTQQEYERVYRQMTQKVNELVTTVNEFVSRFAVVN